MQKQYEQKKVSTALIQELGGLFSLFLLSIIVLGLIKKDSVVPKVGVHEILGSIQ